MIVVLDGNDDLQLTAIGKKKGTSAITFGNDCKRLID
jgi:hypothetical protein